MEIRCWLSCEQWVTCTFTLSRSVRWKVCCLPALMTSVTAVNTTTRSPVDACALRRSAAPLFFCLCDLDSSSFVLMFCQSSVAAHLRNGARKIHMVMISWVLGDLLYCLVLFGLFSIPRPDWLGRMVPKMMYLCQVELSKSTTHVHTHNHFTALWTLSGTTRVSQYQKVHFAIFWTFWSKLKITQADTPTIWMDCHPSRLIGAPTSAIPTIFTPDALPYTTLPMCPGLGQAPNMLACILGGLVHTRRLVVKRGKYLSHCPKPG